MERFRQILHWTSFTYLVYLFGNASLYKIFEDDGMLDAMLALGFNRVLTLFIGWAEFVAVLGLLAGIWWRRIKNLSALILLPFAIGALSAHVAHCDYADMYDALFGIICICLLLLSDENFRVKL